MTRRRDEIAMQTASGGNCIRETNDGIGDNVLRRAGMDGPSGHISRSRHPGRQGRRLMRRFRSIAFVVLALSVVGQPPGAAAARASENFPALIELPDGFAPEGITGGPGTTVFVGSLQDGSIWRGDVRTGEGSVLVNGPGTMAVGVNYEPRAGRLWVAGGDSGTVKVYDAATGDHLATYTLAGSGFLNDLTITRDAVYVTDSFVQRLAVIPLGRGGSLPAADAVRTLDLTGEMPWIAGEFNANGIESPGGGRYLLVVQSIDSATSQLFRVDAATGDTVEVDLGGARLVDGDGLELRGHTLNCVRGNTGVVVVKLDDHLTRGTVVETLSNPTFDYPTTAALSAGRLWVVNARFATPPEPDTRYWITRLDV
jgi:hypothetical protein